MTQARTVVLDNEAVRALIDPRHRKHRRMLAMVEAVAARNLRRAGSVTLVVPTAVRVEAAWDHRAPKAAAINRLRVHDHALDSRSADHAAGAVAGLRVSVADAHLAAVLGSTSGPHAVLTSDIGDVNRIVAGLGAKATVVRV